MTSHIFRLGAIMAVFFLGACALPMPLQVASLIADGFSLVTTNKTVADHGVSAMMEKDCSFMRGMQEGSLCRENDGVLVAAVAVEDEPVLAAGVVVDEVAPVEALATFETASGGPTLPQEKPTLESRSGLYWVIGSFARERDALGLAQTYEMLEPRIVSAQARGKSVFRVAVGPFSPKDREVYQARIQGLGVHDAWSVWMAPGA